MSQRARPQPKSGPDAQLIAEYTAAFGPADEDLVCELIDVKCKFLGGEADDWSPQVLDELLYEVYPAQVIADPEDLTKIPGVAAQLMRVLAKRSPGRRAELEELAGATEKMTKPFSDEMNDKGNWSPGKRVWSAAEAEGVDFDDPAAIARWMEGFNQRSREERDQVLENMGLPPKLPVDSGWKPLEPVRLPSGSEIAEALEQAVMLHRLVRLVAFVGEGRPATENGQLRRGDVETLVEQFDAYPPAALADPQQKQSAQRGAQVVKRTLQVAQGAQLLESGDGVVVPGDLAHEAGEASLELAWLAFSAVMEATVGLVALRRGAHRQGLGLYPEALDSELANVLEGLYRDGATELAHAAAAVLDSLQDSYELVREGEPTPDLHLELVLGDLVPVMHDLAELGVVRFAHAPAVGSLGEAGSDTGGVVELDRIGWYVMNRYLSQFEEAPAVGRLRSLPAGVLLGRIAELPDDLASAEIDLWVSDRPETAVTELAKAMVTAQRGGRKAAYQALLQMGPSVGEAMATVEGAAELKAVLAVDTQAAGLDEMDRSDDPAAWVRMMATVIDLWGGDAAIGRWADATAGAPGLAKMFDQVWRIPGQDTEDVLSAIGSDHGDKRVAKAARKALFKRRSSPG